MDVGLGPGHIVLDGDPAPLAKKGDRAPQFSAHVYCGQTAGWIKIALGINVGFGPGHIVLDGDPAPLAKKETEPLNFWPISIVAKRLDGLRYHLVWRKTPLFGPCLLWLRSPISDAAELLFIHTASISKMEGCSL